MRITVVGDVLLDIDLWGPDQRPAPDGGTPIVDVTRTNSRAGGAGLVATLLRRDGHEVRLVTAIGSDDSAERVRELLGDVELVACDSQAPTPVKTRLRAGDATVARLDVGCAPPPPPRITPALCEALGECDALIVSDYGRRLTADERLRETVRRVADELPVVWDPHPRGSRPVPGVSVSTPNRAEAVGFAETDDVEAAAHALRRDWGAHAVAVTLGADGVLLEAEERRRLPAERIDVADGCGAGDRFAASAAIGLARGERIEAAIGGAIRETGRFLAAGGVATL
jgi:rfaE bifunctional protein kinase chain/domain